MIISLQTIRRELTDMSNRVMAYGWALENAQKVSDLKPGTNVDEILTEMKALETAIDALREKLYNAQSA